ncbi:MAG TPA: BatA domain-containing protein [Candidatus Ozemobacteraceae bacterium]|nr:BatA domain-containing protein [Candidatus Ozemobacteraceae bacterium]
MPQFAFPAFFLALPLAAAALVAIYWLRNRFNPIRVSSLLLWQSQKEARESGVTLHRLQTPLLFFLELLALAAMACAAATPLLETTQEQRPYVIILDDSLSMLSGGNDSPREKSLQQIRKELEGSISYPVRFLLAGPEPVFLDSPARNRAEVMLALESWRCRSPRADLAAAIALAEETLGGNGRILVFTDHQPPGTTESGKTRWLAFGQVRPNLAIVNAVRGGSESRDRLLLELANYSSDSQTCTLIMTGLSTETQQVTVKLNAQERQRREFEIASSASTVKVQLTSPNDALSTDNDVVLLPRSAPRVKVAMNFKNGILKSQIERALISSGHIVPATDEPDLFLTDDQTVVPPSPGAWLVQFLPHTEALSYTGPFFIDPVHPLTQGVTLAGVVWGAGKSELPGRHLLSVGNVPLISEQDIGTSRTIRIKLRPDLSTLHLSPAWPILLYNLVDWRIRFLPGPTQPNLRLFQEVSFTVSPGIESLSGSTPDGRTLTLPVFAQGVSFRPEAPGLYSFSGHTDSWQLSVNAFEPLESDLASATTGTWGSWTDAATLEKDFRPMTDAVLAFVLVILALHQLAVFRRPKGIRI